MSPIFALFIALNQPSFQDFATAPAVAETDRLALTPKLDGKIEAEEWDVLSSGTGAETFFQWEPGKLHAGGRIPTGSALILSLDLKANGWLVGKDNLEVKVTWQNDKPKCVVRQLDATNVSGPVWIESPMYQDAIACAATAESGNWTVELTLVDPGLNQLPDNADRKLAVRIDSVPATSSEIEPFQPRALAPVKLVWERGSNIPAGLKWKPQFTSRSVAPGGNIKIRMTFNGADEIGLRKADMRTEGLAKDDTTAVSMPFPNFDNKGRAFVDYSTAVTAGAVDGYRIMRTTLTDESGQTAVLRTSYAIAPLVVFDLAAPGKLKVQEKVQKVRCSVYARSNTNKRIDGTLRIDVPENWVIEKGDDKGFTIYNAFGSVRRVFDVAIPAGAKGAFPIRLQADMGGKAFTQTAWITIN